MDYQLENFPPIQAEAQTKPKSSILISIIGLLLLEALLIFPFIYQFSELFGYLRVDPETRKAAEVIKEKFPKFDTEFIVNNLSPMDDGMSLNVSPEIPEFRTSEYPCLLDVFVDGKSNLYWQVYPAKIKSCPDLKDQVKLTVEILGSKEALADGYVEVKRYPPLEFLHTLSSNQVTENKEEFILMKGKYEVAFSYLRRKYGKQIVNLEKDTEITIEVK